MSLLLVLPLSLLLVGAALVIAGAALVLVLAGAARVLGDVVIGMGVSAFPHGRQHPLWCCCCGRHPSWTPRCRQAKVVLVVLDDR